MIKISKSKTVPPKLQTDGKAENAQNCADYMAKSKSYIKGPLKFDIKNSIYGHPLVKGSLRNSQHSKCCFCEKDQSDENGAVEHFRPKGGYKSSKKESVKKPGYYWLGYEWSNLYFVCSFCNSTANKGNLFPLLDESKRVKSHKGNIKRETPLLLDPAGLKNPRNHIIFEGHLPLPKEKSVYGKKTIEICGLDRDELNNFRKKLINDIQTRLSILEEKKSFKSDVVNKAKIYIKNSVKANAEFSATASDYLKPYAGFLRKFNITID